MTSFFSLSVTKDPHPHWPRGQNSAVLLPGFEPWIFGMTGERFTAEPQEHSLTDKK